MKNRVKTLLALALALLMAAAALGCQLVSVNEEKDLAQIVAKVGDYEITKQEYMDQFEYTLYMYQSFGMDPTASAEELQAFKESILDGVISEQIQYYQALQYGLDKQLTEEELAEIQSQVDEYDTMVFEEATAAAEARVTENANLVLDDVMKEEYRNASLSFFGMEMSQPEARQYVEDFFMKQLLGTKLQDHIYAGITVTDEEVRAAFDEQLASDKASLTSTPSNYKNLQEGFERAGGIPPLYAPAGYKRIKDISIQSDEELSAEYEEKMLLMSDLEAEIGALVLQEEDPEKKAREEDIRAEYNTLKAETDAEFAAYTDKLRARADEAYAKLQGGADFNTVLLEYSSDADYQSYDSFKENGKLLSTAEDVADWDPSIKEAALALTTKGSYTEIITAEDSTFHIIQYVGDEPSGERTFADYEEAIRERTLSNKQSEEWNTLLEEWSSDTSVVTRYPEVLDTI